MLSGAVGGARAVGSGRTGRRGRPRRVYSSAVLSVYIDSGHLFVYDLSRDRFNLIILSPNNWIRVGVERPLSSTK